jgi:ArsR family metal-binding transcriptional regulator
MDCDARADLERNAPAIVFSGWVDYRTPQAAMPDGPVPTEPGACFRRAAIMVLAPCVADDSKIRLVAHLDGDLRPVFPYLNAILPHASYTPSAGTLTYMEGQRMIALYRQRITVAKAEEIVDGWLVLERVRRLVESTWADRERIEPSVEMRRKPPALEILRRLPGTNCRLCGEKTCVAFALRLWRGEVSVRRCVPVFTEAGSRQSEALLEILAGMGMRGTERE